MSTIAKVEVRIAPRRGIVEARLLRAERARRNASAEDMAACLRAKARTARSVYSLGTYDDRRYGVVRATPYTPTPIEFRPGLTPKALMDECLSKAHRWEWVAQNATNVADMDAALLVAGTYLDRAAIAELFT
jgi:hypothetical protein